MPVRSFPVTVRGEGGHGAHDPPLSVKVLQPHHSRAMRFRAAAHDTYGVRASWGEIGLVGEAGVTLTGSAGGRRVA